MVLSSYAGAAVRRKEDPRLITGASTYVDDVKLPNLVEAAFVRSPYAHARINGIDATDALAMPGVIAVYTAADLKKIMPSAWPDTTGETGKSSEEVAAEDDAPIPVPHVYPLATDKVRYVGDPVAVVIAETRALAEDAAAMVTIDAEMLEPAIDPYEAMEDGAPQLYDNVKNNISVVE
ncbi:MAG TPA: xanthine dehydrogenase family protein molybdopterin-binding subunit, partial [Thermomicrobiales bacterium]|nr:xanthine dehydrogenase family protein molybdopterin-binding subunit [Thermomicrobiales bacterium]